MEGRVFACRKVLILNQKETTLTDTEADRLAVRKPQLVHSRWSLNVPLSFILFDRARRPLTLLGTPPIATRQIAAAPYFLLRIGVNLFGSHWPGRPPQWSAGIMPK